MFHHIQIRVPDYYRRMQFLCQSEITPGALPSILDSINETYKRAYLILGPERCRACGYNQVRIEKEINILGLNQANLQQKILEKINEDRNKGKITANLSRGRL